MGRRHRGEPGARRLDRTAPARPALAEVRKGTRQNWLAHEIRALEPEAGAPR
ncbi:MAG: hypothetical protein HY825_20635 [Acidobacteria bacterium]|nr:hypothetical protein [Acidobacteriota bacterium]